MLKIDLVSFEDLTKEEQEIQPNNGSGKEYASYIKITDGYKTLMILSDAVEPEDATFRRDFLPVMTAIKQAYKIGLRDGKKLSQ
jgi:hypothetical protein